MGLDCVFCRPSRDDEGPYEWTAAVEEMDSAPSPVVGFFSPGASFRGKHYAAWFRQKLGVDLYRNKSAEEVRKIAQQLTAYLENHPDATPDVRQLAAMFTKAASHSLIMIADG